LVVDRRGEVCCLSHRVCPTYFSEVCPLPRPLPASFICPPCITVQFPVFFFRRQPRTQTAEFRVVPPLPSKASVSHQPPSTMCPSTVYFRRPPLYQPQLAMSAFNSIPGSPPTGQQRRSSAILVMSPVQTAKNNDAAS
jgi:hypothetical protein